MNDDDHRPCREAGRLWDRDDDNDWCIFISIFIVWIYFSFVFGQSTCVTGRSTAAWHTGSNYTAKHKPRSTQPPSKEKTLELMQWTYSQRVPKPISVWIIPAMIWHVRTLPINWNKHCGALLAKVLQRCVHLSELQKFVVDQRERCHNGDKHSNEGSSRVWNCGTVHWKGEHDDGARRIAQQNPAENAIRSSGHGVLAFPHMLWIHPPGPPPRDDTSDETRSTIHSNVCMWLCNSMTAWNINGVKKNHHWLPTTPRSRPTSVSNGCFFSSKASDVCLGETFF